MHISGTKELGRGLFDLPASLIILLPTIQNQRCTGENREGKGRVQQDSQALPLLSIYVPWVNPYDAESFLVQVVVLIFSNGDRLAPCCNVDRTLRSFPFASRFTFAAFGLWKDNMLAMLEVNVKPGMCSDFKSEGERGKTVAPESHHCALWDSHLNVKEGSAASWEDMFRSVCPIPPDSLVTLFRKTLVQYLVLLLGFPRDKQSQIKTTQSEKNHANRHNL